MIIVIQNSSELDASYRQKLEFRVPGLSADNDHMILATVV